MAFGVIIAAKSVARTARFMSKGAGGPPDPDDDDEDGGGEDAYGDGDIDALLVAMVGILVSAVIVIIITASIP